MKGIKTGIDRLIEMVNKEGKVPITKAAKELDIGKEQVSNWAETLSSKGVIELHYPLTGDGILIKGEKVIGAEMTKIKTTMTIITVLIGWCNPL